MVLGRVTAPEQKCFSKHNHVADAGAATATAVTPTLRSCGAAHREAAVLVFDRVVVVHMLGWARFDGRQLHRISILGRCSGVRWALQLGVLLPLHRPRFFGSLCSQRCAVSAVHSAGVVWCVWSTPLKGIFKDLLAS